MSETIRESAIEQAICRFAKENGVMTYKLASPNDRGKPDRMFMHNGKILFLEMKAPGRVPTPLQHRALRLLTEQGFHAYWVDNVAAGVHWVKEILL